MPMMTALFGQSDYDVMMTAYDVMMTAHDVMMTVHDVMMTAHDVMMTAHDVMMTAIDVMMIAHDDMVMVIALNGMTGFDVMMTAHDVMATAHDDLVSRTEQDLKEEQWERMQNPHLFGGTGGGGYRKVKVGARTTFHEDGNKSCSTRLSLS